MEEKEINIEELLKKAENEQETKAPESEENVNAEAATDTNVTEHIVKLAFAIYSQLPKVWPQRVL